MHRYACVLGSLYYFDKFTTHIYLFKLKNLFLHFLPPLHSGGDFSSGYFTFDIFNNTNFDTIQKSDEK